MRVLLRRNMFSSSSKSCSKAGPKPEIKFFQGYMRSEHVLARIALIDTATWKEKSTFFRVEAVGKVRPLYCSRRMPVKIWDEDDLTWPDLSADF